MAFDISLEPYTLSGGSLRATLECGLWGNLKQDRRSLALRIHQLNLSSLNRTAG